MTTKYTNTRTDQTTSRLINGAKALHELFYRGGVKDEPARDVRKDIRAKYDLSTNQLRELSFVSSALYAAQRVVSYLGEKYSDDFKGLYREAAKEEVAECNSANASGFSMLFYLPESHFRKVGTKLQLGGATSCNPMYLRINLTDALDQIKNREYITADLSGLVIRINKPAIANGNTVLIGDFDSVEDRSLLSAFHDLLVTDHGTCRHELKHVIDNFIRASYFFPAELSAYMYDKATPTRKHFDITIQENILPEIEDAKSRYGSKANKHIESGDRAIDQLNAFPIELLEDIVGLGIELDVLSFVVSTTPIEKLRHRFELIRDYLRANPTTE